MGCLAAAFSEGRLTKEGPAIVQRECVDCAQQCNFGSSQTLGSHRLRWLYGTEHEHLAPTVLGHISTIENASSIEKDRSINSVHLEQMILHDIPNNAELVKVAPAATSADVFLESDLDTLNVVSAALDQHIMWSLQHWINT